MKILGHPKCYPAICALTVTMMLATAVFMGGCGKKGSPEPPTGSRPPRVKDLGYGLSQNTIKLSWSVPQPDDKAQLPITGFLIYRAQEPLSQTECPNCPVMFKSVGDVPVRGAGPGQPPITFAETIESGYRYTYKVHGYSDVGVRSRSSNFVEFRF